jgi:hypothetical protein
MACEAAKHSQQGQRAAKLSFTEKLITLKVEHSVLSHHFIAFFTEVLGICVPLLEFSHQNSHICMRLAKVERCVTAGVGCNCFRRILRIQP